MRSNFRIAVLKTIVEIKFGSHLYGTSTPSSDLDFKSVFVPDSADILLQRVTPTISTKRPKQMYEKNHAGDVDREAHALHRYLGLLSEGQTVALDMLFAPRWAMVEEPLPLWAEIVQNRHRLLSRRAGSFVGYCRAQANKYGIKGSRVHAVRRIVEWFDETISRHGHLARLHEAADSLPKFIADQHLEHTAIVEINHPSRPDPIRHLECCNRKTPFFNTLKDSRAVYARLLDEYGARAFAAERNEGIDWKALSHAVRVGHEAIELLKTGWITFPLLNASHVKRIKCGELPYAAVAEEIESLLELVEAAQETSCLADAPDSAFIESFVEDAYAEVVRAART